MRNVIASVKKLDDNNVEITLKKVYPSFLNLLTGGSAKMVSPAAAKAGTIGRKADGTGPYMLQEYKTGEYVLEKKTRNTGARITARMRLSGLERGAVGDEHGAAFRPSM